MVVKTVGATRFSSSVTCSLRLIQLSSGGVSACPESGLSSSLGIAVRRARLRGNDLPMSKTRANAPAPGRAADAAA